MEIERKWLVRKVPEKLDTYTRVEIEQAYLCTDPVIRVRHCGDAYILTVKSSGKMAREEYEFPLRLKAFQRLFAKARGSVIKKTRYLIPLSDLTVELDHFHEPNAGLWLAEVEFPSVEKARGFSPPSWFGNEVTEDPAYYNVSMSRL